AAEGLMLATWRLESLQAIIKIPMKYKPNVIYLQKDARARAVFGMGKWIHRNVHAADQNVLECSLSLMNHRWCVPALADDEVSAIAHRAIKEIPYDPTIPIQNAVAAGHFFAEVFGDVVRYDEKRKEWFVWGTHRWIPGRSEARRLAQGIARHMMTISLAFPLEDSFLGKVKISLRQHPESGGLREWAEELLKRDGLNGMMNEAQHLRPVVDEGTGWDENPHLLCCENGVVDLRTGEKRDGRPEDRIT